MRASQSSGYVRRRAFGRHTNLLWLLAIATGIYVGYVMLTPRVAAYGVKTALRAGCQDYMRTTLWNENDEGWRQEFLSRVRRAGVNLNEDQYWFELRRPCVKKSCNCQARAAFPLETEWPLLQDFFGEDVKPYRSVHRFEVEIEYKSEWH